MTTIIFSLDNTASMRPAAYEAKRRIKQVAEDLFDQIPDLMIGMIAHWDCTAMFDYPKYVEQIEPTRHPQALHTFLDRLQNVANDDEPEMYEAIPSLAMQMFTPGEHNVLVVVGDEVPHGFDRTSDTPGKRNPPFKWSDAYSGIAALGVKVYGVQCLGKRHATPFYDAIGKRLDLQQFSLILNLIEAVSYKENGRLDEYVAEVERRGPVLHGLASLIRQLSNGDYSPSHIAHRGNGLIPVPPHRFQVLHVDKAIPMRDFVALSGAEFRKGHGFYQLVNRELVQQTKEVVLRDRITGDMFTGPEARLKIGLPFGQRGKISPVHLDEYDVFVRSDSFTRKLDPQTLFLYEVDGWDR